MGQAFEFHMTDIEGLYEVVPFYAGDLRGGFTKDYSREVFQAHGIYHELAEVFYTTSHKGVLRGLHFQRIKQQAKLVRCISGRVWDVAVDLRKDSPTFMQYRAFELTGENRREVLIPGGCAHGYLVLNDSVVSYKCGERFYGEYDDGIVWDDPDLAIKWPLDMLGIVKPVLSEKDQMLQSFRGFMDAHGGF